MLTQSKPLLLLSSFSPGWWQSTGKLGFSTKISLACHSPIGKLAKGSAKRETIIKRKAAESKHINAMPFGWNENATPTCVKLLFKIWVPSDWEGGGRKGKGQIIHKLAKRAIWRSDSWLEMMDLTYRKTILTSFWHHAVMSDSTCTRDGLYTFRQSFLIFSRFRALQYNDTVSYLRTAPSVCMANGSNTLYEFCYSTEVLSQRTHKMCSQQPIHPLKERLLQIMLFLMSFQKPQSAKCITSEFTYRDRSSIATHVKRERESCEFSLCKEL